MKKCNSTQIFNVDFILQYNGLIIPVEIKAEENLHAKSLRIYHEKFDPDLSVRSSMSDYRQQDWLTNVPLYALSQINKLFEGIIK
ncbi:MAG: hypothetical protein K8R68_09785 [Bacteroidales bacterium]|nr:hypothetical protein [Bacteroidales bacterium]